MKIKFIPTLLFLIAINVSAVHAETSYVYCAQPDGSDWRWLVDSSNNYVQVTGQWGREILSNDSYFNYFSISEATYLAVSRLCPEGTVAQSGDLNSSYWEVFKDPYGIYLILGTKTILGSGINHSLRRLI